MLYREVAASLQNVVEADDVAFDVYVGMVDAVAYACLRCEIDDDGRLIFGGNAF